MHIYVRPSKSIKFPTPRSVLGGVFGAQILHPPQQLDCHPKLVRQQPVAVETTYA